MRIEVRRSGGFAGIARTWSVDTAALPPARAAQIERLARALRPGALAGGDVFSYEVTIDGRTKGVEDAEELIEEIGRP